MSFPSWPQSIRSALVPGRGRRPRGRRASLRAVRLRPGIEALEDRRVPAFVAPVDYTVGGDPVGMQAGDFNGDGIPDLVTLNAGSFSVLLSNGDGTFQPARNTPTTNNPYASGGNAFAVGDFNRDGKLDVADNGVNVLLGRGDGTFV